MKDPGAEWHILSFDVIDFVNKVSKQKKNRTANKIYLNESRRI